MLGLHCCADFSLLVESGGYSLVAACRLLTVVAPLVTYSSGALGHRLVAVARRPSCCMTCGIFPRPETEPESPALAGRFFTSEPWEKPWFQVRKTFDHILKGPNTSSCVSYSQGHLEFTFFPQVTFHKKSSPAAPPPPPRNRHAYNISESSLLWVWNTERKRTLFHERRVWWRGR